MKYNKHIAVVGSARSGTSWLSEVIARQHRYRMLFEPEHEHQTKKGILLCDKYFTEENHSREADTYFKRIFANTVDCDWIGQISNRKWKRHLWPFIPKKYVIKFVRCNLSAKYINEHFQIPLVHILRNPYDVIKSQQRVKFPWLYKLDHFVAQPHLVELIENNFGLDITDVNKYSEVELLALRWCIENVIPLELKESYQYKSEVVKHEDLRSDISIFLNLCRKFNLEPLSNIDDEYSRPSSKAHPNGIYRNSHSQQKALATTEVLRINHILDQFETNLYPRK